MDNILEFAQNTTINSRSIKKFCKLVFEQELIRYGFPFEVTLRVCWLPYRANGYVRTGERAGKRRACVTINTAPFLRDRSKHSICMTWFYIFATLVHELEHVQLSVDLEGDSLPEYTRFIAGLCQTRKIRRKQWSGIVPNYSQMKLRMTSLPELICTQVGFQRGFEVLGIAMDKQERELVSQMIKSVEFLCDHLEITYAVSSQPYNQFSRCILSIHDQVKKEPQLLSQLKQLRHVVDENGNFYAPQYLYEQSLNTSEIFYDNMLIHLFLLFDMDWQTAFDQNRDLFLHMEGLANRYCQQSVFYLKNIQVGEAFLSVDVLQDNAAMLIRNTERMNALMRRFGMKHIKGSVIPLYV